ncbi:putative nucleotidyltransferase [Kibdelosporangium phytohabitans]|nr:putative nucleotidyltransferase [Kibdelosporangium phytohabitans]
MRTVTKVAAALRPTGVSFALTGGCAVYARGGPETEHDVDILILEQDVPTAVKALVEAGFRAADPPEEWLTKVYDGDRLVDLIFRANERQVTPEMLDHAEEMRVGPTVMRVQHGTEVMIGKLLALEVHRCDLAALLPIARALREQIDWGRVREQTAESPYAEAFLLLCDRLGIIDEGSRSDDTAAVPGGAPADHFGGGSQNGRARSAGDRTG